MTRTTPMSSDGPRRPRWTCSTSPANSAGASAASMGWACSSAASCSVSGRRRRWTRTRRSNTPSIPRGCSTPARSSRGAPPESRTSGCGVFPQTSRIRVHQLRGSALRSKRLRIARMCVEQIDGGHDGRQHPHLPTGRARAAPRQRQDPQGARPLDSRRARTRARADRYRRRGHQRRPATSTPSGGGAAGRQVQRHRPGRRHRSTCRSPPASSQAPTASCTTPSASPASTSTRASR